MGNDESKKISNRTGESTIVDLGDDLLAPTIAISSPKQQPSGKSTEKSNDELNQEQYENAKILVSEGFVEDAKKVFRKILISDPNHVGAKQGLKEILDRELKDLLMDRDAPVQRPRLFERKGKVARGPQPTSEEVLKELEEELKLNTTEEPIASLVPENADLKDATPSDRVDLGIAFLEMGQYDEAITQLRAAIDLIDREPEPQLLQKNSAIALLIQAYLLADRPYDAIHTLHAVLRDTEISATDKIEFFYLMGLSHEKLGDRKTALPWYAKVRDIDPHYRDIQARMRK